MEKKQTNSNVAELKAVKATRATAAVFDPATVPVLSCYSEPYHVPGSRRTRWNAYFSDVDGVRHAAILIGEDEVSRYIKKGCNIVYACGLNALTTDLSLIEASLRAQKVEMGNWYPTAAELPYAMACYAQHVGKLREPSTSSAAPEFKHEHGMPHDYYVGCEDQVDADKLHAGTEKEYARILKLNAKAAKSPTEIEPLFVESSIGRTPEQSVLHFAVAALEHEARAQAARDESIRRSNVYKAKHCLSRLDHGDPRYQAFTWPTWGAYLSQRDYAKQARALLNRATQAYIEESAA